MPAVYSYSFGKIVVDGVEYRNDIILFWNGKVEKWWRKEGHHVCLEDINSILESEPEVVVFGTGKHGVMKVGKDVINALKDRGIECIELISDRAVEEFNNLVKSKRAVLAIHLTC
jgi:hypothetical protein